MRSFAARSIGLRNTTPPSRRRRIRTCVIRILWKSAVPAALSATNIYGQTYSMRVYKEPSGALDMAVVTEGGAAIPQRSLMRIAKWIGGAGGYISGAAPADAQG